MYIIQAFVHLMCRQPLIYFSNLFHLFPSAFISLISFPLCSYSLLLSSSIICYFVLLSSFVYISSLFSLSILFPISLVCHELPLYPVLSLHESKGYHTDATIILMVTVEIYPQTWREFKPSLAYFLHLCKNCKQMFQNSKMLLGLAELHDLKISGKAMNRRIMSVTYRVLSSSFYCFDLLLLVHFLLLLFLFFVEIQQPFITSLTIIMIQWMLIFNRAH